MMNMMLIENNDSNSVAHVKSDSGNEDESMRNEDVSSMVMMR